MPIPFLAGLALGCAAMYAYGNRDKIKEGASKIAKNTNIEDLKASVKEGAEKLGKKSKKILKDAKDTLGLDGASETKKTRKKPGPKPGSKKTAAASASKTAASASKTAASKTAAAGKTRKKPGPKPGSKRTKNTAAKPTSSTSGSAKKRASTAKAASISIPQVVSPNDNFNVSQTFAGDKSQK